MDKNLKKNCNVKVEEAVAESNDVEDDVGHTSNGHNNVATEEHTNKTEVEKSSPASTDAEASANDKSNSETTSNEGANAIKNPKKKKSKKTKKKSTRVQLMDNRVETGSDSESMSTLWPLSESLLDIPSETSFNTSTSDETKIIKDALLGLCPFPADDCVLKTPKYLKSKNRDNRTATKATDNLSNSDDVNVQSFDEMPTTSDVIKLPGSHITESNDLPDPLINYGVDRSFLNEMPDDIKKIYKDFDEEVKAFAEQDDIKRALIYNALSNCDVNDFEAVADDEDDDDGEDNKDDNYGNDTNDRVENKLVVNERINNAKHLNEWKQLCIESELRLPNMDYNAFHNDKDAFAKRFQYIMEMFESFTQNLESLQMSQAFQNIESVMDTEHPTELNLNFADIEQCLSRLKQTTDTEGTESNIDEMSLQNYMIVTVNEKFPYSLNNSEQIDISTTMSGDELNLPLPITTQALIHDDRTTTSTATLTTAAGISASSTTFEQYTKCSTIACQTSTLKLQFVNEKRAHTTTEIDNDMDSYDEIIVLSTDVATNTINDSDGNLLIVEPSENSLDKISVAQSITELNQCLLTNQPRGGQMQLTIPPPCDRTYHTIHIEATASPSSSTMRRPPLCLRFWNVVTDFCAAICLCLQVNKDCIFCLGFFIAFIVSASFLTAFFYRSLSVTPQGYHHHASATHAQQQHYQNAGLAVSSRENFFM